jgi:hypothetical protein
VVRSEMRRTKVDMADTLEVEETRGKRSAKVAHGWNQLPYDLPVILEIFRLYEDAKDSDLRGWVVDFDAFTFGRHFLIRIDKGRPPKIRLFMKPDEGEYELLGEWEMIR